LIVSVFLNLQYLTVRESILNLNQLQVKNKIPQTFDSNLDIFDRSLSASSNWLCRAHLSAQGISLLRSIEPSANKRYVVTVANVGARGVKLWCWPCLFFYFFKI
jgi:hypothetical protein